MTTLKVELKSGQKGVVALKVRGPQAEFCPAAFVNYYSYEKGYAEVPPTPYSFERLKQWATENSIELQVNPAVDRWLEKEKISRDYYDKYDDVVLGEDASKDLYPHQITAVKRAVMNGAYRAPFKAVEPFAPVRLLLADDPRLGKSAEAMRIIQAVESNGFILILCPKALIEQWVDYAHTWLKYPIVNTLKGTGKERLEQLERIRFDYGSNTKGKRHIVVITNWESLHMPPVLKSLREVGWTAIVGDEAHKLKNRKSQVRTAVASLKTKHMLLLSATFTENWPSDYWSPLNLIEPNLFSSYWRFAGFFIQTSDGHFGPEFAKTKDADILRDFLTPWVIQRRSDDVADMPEKIRETVVCELSKEHRAFYDEISKRVRVELSDGPLNMTNKVSKILRLRQAAIHPMLIDPGASFDFDTGKFAMLKTLLEDVVPEGEQVLIYSNFIKSCEIAASVLSDHKPVIYAGNYGQPSDIEKFQTGEFKVFIATPQKGGVGLNLFNANYLIYLDVPYSTITLRQSEERVRAIGKRGPVYIMRLEALDTIDDWVQDLVDLKLKNVSETEVIDYLVKKIINE